MDGRSYEIYCADYLRQQGYRNVQVTKGSHDQGIDVIAWYRHKKYGIQCKYYESPVSNHSVMEAYTGGAFYGCDHVMVMTNSTFTKSAKELADETDVILLEHVSPEKNMSFWKKYRLYCLPLIFWGIIMLTKITETDGDLRIIYASLCVISGLCGFSSQMVPLGISVSSALLFLIIHFSFYLHLHSKIESVLLLYTCAFTIQNIVFFQRSYRKHQFLLFTNDRLEIRSAMQTQSGKLGKILAELLSEEFHSEIVYSDGKRQKDGSDILTFRSRAKIKDDIALVEYSLNQLVQHEKIHDHYQLLLINDHEFTVTIEHR